MAHHRFPGDAFPAAVVGKVSAQANQRGPSDKQGEIWARDGLSGQDIYNSVELSTSVRQELPLRSLCEIQGFVTSVYYNFLRW